MTDVVIALISWAQLTKPLQYANLHPEQDVKLKQDVKTVETLRGSTTTVED